VSTKRLAVFLAAGVATYVVARIGIAFLPESTQAIHRRQVREHIKAIAADWERFKMANSGFELIEFWPDTRDDGLFGIRGCLTSQVQVVKLLTFITNSQPPRPLYTNQLKVVDADTFALIMGEDLAGGDPANGGKPFSAESNRPPSSGDSPR